jgi:hypothetical protein
MNGLFINSKKTTCSIYESGIMIYNILKKSSLYTLEYIENPKFRDDKSPLQEFIPNGYDFYVFNWHVSVNNIPKYMIDKLTGIKICIILEVGNNNIFIATPDNWFDAHMVIDTTKEREKNIYIFPRPLEIIEDIKPILDKNKLVLGSFGLHIPGKKFEEIIEVANSLKEECIIRINLYEGMYVGNQNLNNYFDTLRRLGNSSLLDIRLTSNYMTKQELISWCSEHTLNVFPYYRNSPGLSATTDQAISSGRAIAITDSNTFRHMRPYISYYPEQSYLELVNSTPSGVKQMQEDWHPSKFLSLFEELLSDNPRKIKQGITVLG